MTAMSSTGSGPARSEHRISHSSQHSSDRPTSAHSRLNASSKDGGFKEPEHADEKVNQPRRRDGELFAPRRRVTYKRIPFFSTPQSDEGLPWLSEDAVATEWLGLFYNLAVTSTFTTFNASHQLRTPSGLPSYLAYFTAIVAMWTVQVHYDIRFQGNDMVHRLAKAAQVVLYIYMAAASGGWDLSKLAPPSSRTASELISHQLASQSFLTVAIVLATHCGLLAGQYVLVTLLGRRVQRRTTSTRWSFFALAISCALYIAAGAIPASSHGRAAVKIALLYLGVGVQMICIGLQALNGVQVPVRDGVLAQQYGAFSLTMLGTGFTSIAQAFRKALSGIQTPSGTSYAQVFLCAGVIYFIWAYMFANFHKTVEVDPGRTWIWEALHYPLHFCVLALIGAMTNCINVNVWSRGLLSTYRLFRRALSEILDDQIDQARAHDFAMTFDRLKLNPDFATELARLTQPGQSKAAVTVRAYQYFAQVIHGTCQQSGVALNSSPSKLLNKVLDLDRTGTPDGATADQARDLIIRAIEEVMSDAFSGVLWLYPAAGGILIFAALRSVNRFHFRGLAGYAIHTAMFTGGVTLCLLGLLALGSKQVWFDDSPSHSVHYGNPLYGLVSKSMGIAIVFLVYLAVQLGYMLAMEIGWRVFHVEREQREQS